MKCPICQSEDHKVIDSRRKENGIFRRRECLSCGFRFNTVENIFNGEKKKRKMLPLASGIDNKHEYVLLIRNKEQ